MSTWAAGRGVVELPDGRRVRGRGLRKNSLGSIEPEFGVYLLGRDPNIKGWPARWVRWRDFRLPDSTGVSGVSRTLGVKSPGVV